MKKHLLAALLVVGSMSYAAAVVPASGTAKLPIKVEGVVVSSNADTLVVEVLSNAGASKGEFLFNFGTVTDATTTHGKKGEFKVYMTDRTGKVKPLTKKPVVALEKDGTEATTQSTKINGIEMNYSLDNVAYTAGAMEATSAVNVDIDTTNIVVGGLAHFNDESVSLTVTVK